MTGQDRTGELDAILDEATAWHVASVRDDMDWDGFAAWLAADLRHKRAYDQVALADSLLDDHRDVLHAGPDNAELEAQEAGSRTRIGWLPWAGLVVAASLTAVLAVPRFLSSPPIVYQTGAAAQSVALADGSTVVLAPHSRLTVGNRQDQMQLAGGAWFDIRHDPARPLAIAAGEIEVSDIGTRFDIQTTGKQVRVAIAEGEVQVVSPVLDRTIRLARGRALLFDSASGKAVVGDMATEAIGQWRTGHLTYRETPLPLVIADLGRYAGVRIELGQELRDQQFSGTLVIGNGEAALRDLSQLMGLELHRGAGGYRLDQRER